MNESLWILLVDDGSTDTTGEIIRRIEARHPRVKTLILPQNHGKAEAVRAGLLYFMNCGSFEWLAYADADFATPAEEIVRLLAFAKEATAEAAFGSRVMLLGTQIHRRPMRHYLGRVFATAASLALRLPVYDTQCGAKVFSNSGIFRKALERPFLSKWAFDVELIGRIAAQLPDPTQQLLEMPLKQWRDVKGSALTLRGMLRAFLDVFRIAILVRRARL